MEPDRWRAVETQIRYRHVGCFVGPCTGIVKEKQYRVVPKPLRHRAIGKIKKGIYLGFFQIGHDRFCAPLKRDSPDFRAPRYMLRAAFRDKSGQRVDCGEALVSGDNRAPSRLFEML